MPAAVSSRLNRMLDLRDGEGRTLAVLAGYMFLSTATVTFIAAAMNGLFLSVYPGHLIPYAVIAAAFVTALSAVAFAAVIAGTARRSLAVGLTVVLVATLAGSRTAFQIDERSSFALYLILSATQVLIVTHAWDYVGDLLTGRQAKRLMPLIGIGASVGALLGGFSVAPLAPLMGTSNLLLLAGVLLTGALPLLWLVPEPDRGEQESLGMDAGAVRNFLRGAGRGFRALGGEPLLRVMAGGVIFLALTGTLIELQFKLAVQVRFDQDRITAVYGLLGGMVGFGTLLVQILASRVIFPRFGVSFAAMLHSGVLALAAGAVTLLGGFFILAALQALDDILQQSLQKPVEQVSLLPFPSGTKGAAVATLGGVLQPLAQAAGGTVAVVLAARGALLPSATALAGLTAFLIFTRHRRRYLAALQHALAKHTVDFGAVSRSTLMVDREALAVIDRGLGDPDPTVVVFSLSLLERIPPAEALPRILPLLGHDVAEVRAEAAIVIGRLDTADESGYRTAVLGRIDAETDPFVLSALLATTGGWDDHAGIRVERFLTHADGRVRREALVALGRSGWSETRETLDRMLGSDDPVSRWAAAGAVGALGLEELIDRVAGLVADPYTRPAALDALVELGAPAVPALAALLRDRALPLSLRRSVVTALAGIDSRHAHGALMDLLEEPALGPAALTSLLRLRRGGALDAVPSAAVRPLLEGEIRRGSRYALAAAAIRQEHATDVRAGFVAHELEEIRTRSVYRVLRVLALAYDPTTLTAVESGLLSGRASDRSNALELLEGTLRGEDARLVLPFAEATADGFAVDRVAPLLGDVTGLLARPLETLVEEPDWWPRALALHALGRDHEITAPGRSKEPPPPPDADREEDVPMIPLIEKVMILKGSQLFRDFPGNELAGIASVAEVVHLEKGDQVFRQGDPGDAFYMVVRGAIRITRDSHELAVLGPREGFGEMAILDQETRSASATAAETSTLLKVDRDSFDRLIEQNPAVARGIYRVLNRRLRNTLAQLATG